MYMLITEHGCLPKKLNSYSHYAFQNQASQRLIYIIIYDVCMPAAVLVQASNHGHISFCLFQLICSVVCSAVMSVERMAGSSKKRDYLAEFDAEQRNQSTTTLMGVLFGIIMITTLILRL